MENTTFNEIYDAFDSLPMSKYLLQEGLKRQWLLKAIGDVELDLGKTLEYDLENNTFLGTIDIVTINTLSLLMYTYYLTRELSRAEKINGFSGKDLTMTGSDGSKRITYADLELELSRTNIYLHKQKTPAYN